MTLLCQCPSCWESTAIEVFGSDEKVELWEDCQVCCHPMRLIVRFREGEVVSLEVSGEL
jgi:hypothetical protein